MDEANRLWAMAVQSAGARGMEFTVPCSRNVKDLILAGMRSMRRQGRMGENDWEEAAQHWSRIVEEMILATAQGLEKNPGRKTPIREDALVRAKRLCPLWPFC